MCTECHSDGKNDGKTVKTKVDEETTVNDTDTADVYERLDNDMDIHQATLVGTVQSPGYHNKTEVGITRDTLELNILYAIQEHEQNVLLP